MRIISIALFLVALGLVACDDSGTSSTEQNADTEQVSSSSVNTIVEQESSSSVVANDAKLSSSSEKDVETKSSSSINSAVEPESSADGKIGSSSSSEEGGDATSSSSVIASEAKQSSSSENLEESSSSEVKISYGTMTDSRDGQTYKTVTIGTQTWMAENLNYAYTEVPFKYKDYTSDSTSWCYKNDAANCAKYGRLYTWAVAMDSVGEWSTNGKGCGFEKECSPTYPVRGICPKGWHLPTNVEWGTLLTVAGGKSAAGKVLKSQSGWYNNGNGTDAFGFSALPAGYKDISFFHNDSYGTTFWKSNEHYSYDTYEVSLHYNDDSADLNEYRKYFGFSVRCVKD